MKVSVTLLLCLLVCCQCGQLPDAIRQEIQNRKDDVTRIINHVLSGDGKHQAITRLAEMTDQFGPRLTGSQALEDAIDYSVDSLENHGGFVVNTEEVTANKWTRNVETAAILTPRYHEMALMSLGSSVGGHIEAEVVVVKDYTDLDTRAAANPDVFRDKIVLYNMEWVGYSDTVIYRNDGASRAAKHGAAAALIRSVTDFSIYSPHTGIQRYNSTVSSEEIPIAAITVEDAHQIQRYSDRGESVTVRLNMTCENHGTITTRNVIAELRGSEKPEEVVIIGGHIDSWDVGFGVMDDGGGVMISWQALLNLKDLNLVPKRTIRAIFWTAEEIGLVGADQYFDAHKDNEGNISLIMESDYGTFTPIGLGFTGSGKAWDILTEILSLLEPINATRIQEGGSSPDTGMWLDIGVPGANLWNANDKYFFYHHSDGDSITMEDPDDLDKCAIVFTVVAYVVACLEDKLPRTGEYPAPPPSGAHSSLQPGGGAGHVLVVMVTAFVCMAVVRRLVGRQI